VSALEPQAAWRFSVRCSGSQIVALAVFSLPHVEPKRAVLPSHLSQWIVQPVIPIVRRSCVRARARGLARAGRAGLAAPTVAEVEACLAVAQRQRVERVAGRTAGDRADWGVDVVVPVRLVGREGVPGRQVLVHGVARRRLDHRRVAGDEGGTAREEDGGAKHAGHRGIGGDAQTGPAGTRNSRGNAQAV
jgi:hypothetical protein